MSKRLQQTKLNFGQKRSISKTATHDSDSGEEKRNGNLKSTKEPSKTKPAAKFSPFLSLESSLNDPTMQVFKNDQFVCIRDKYPKARFHMLLVPRGGPIKLTSVEDVIRLSNAVSFLKQMRQLAHEIVEKNCPDEVVKSKFQYGFHAIQSMSPLHMHIISRDFVSDCLKHKKHWNSFTSPYFIHLDELIENLSENSENYFAKDKFNLMKPAVLKGYLDLALKCHVCNAPMSNIPNLKKHILTHV